VGRPLPSHYRELLAFSNGGHPEKDTFPVEIRGLSQTWGIKRFFWIASEVQRRTRTGRHMRAPATRVATYAPAHASHRDARWMVAQCHRSNGRRGPNETGDRLVGWSTAQVGQGEERFSPVTHLSLRHWIYQLSGLMLISKKSAKINAAPDLKGRSLAVWYGGSEFEFLALIDKLHYDAGQRPQRHPAGVSP